MRRKATGEPAAKGLGGFHTELQLKSLKKILIGVQYDTGKLSQYQKIYSTDRSYEFAVRAVPPACLDFPETE